METNAKKAGLRLEEAETHIDEGNYVGAARHAAMAFGRAPDSATRERAIGTWRIAIVLADQEEIGTHLQSVANYKHLFNTPLGLEAQRIRLGRREPLAPNPSKYEFH